MALPGMGSRKRHDIDRSAKLLCDMNLQELQQMRQRLVDATSITKLFKDVNAKIPVVELIETILWALRKDQSPYTGAPPTTFATLINGLVQLGKTSTKAMIIYICHLIHNDKLCANRVFVVLLTQMKPHADDLQRKIGVKLSEGLQFGQEFDFAGRFSNATVLSAVEARPT